MDDHGWYKEMKPWIFFGKIHQSLLKYNLNIFYNEEKKSLKGQSHYQIWDIKTAKQSSHDVIVALMISLVNSKVVENCCLKMQTLKITPRSVI